MVSRQRARALSHSGLDRRHVPVGPAERLIAGGRAREAMKVVRDWVKSSGWAVSDRGRLPKYVVEAYDAAHKWQPLA
ncbi:histone-like nucleoid-structuring protein Lsr2 [Actinomycetospora sp. NBRC 106375]|uniref:Lsr2 family DNA-binding protein n=1 Tax=Actinomycetospora sp. NBRC 106375 TaxID=3032207 RepID=UPI002556C4E1|nr:histone-like nucleoid-structuring protein Lsr2 [Actinomycetospora sp. NBRC 106375]